MPTTACPCGEIFHYSTEHGGNSIRCRCGRIVELPTVGVATRAEAPLGSPATESIPSTSRFSRKTLFGLAGALGVILAVALVSISQPVEQPVQIVSRPSQPDPLAGYTPDWRTRQAGVVAPTGGCSTADSGSDWRPLRNAVELRRPARRGQSSLTIRNGTDLDAFVQLVDSLGAIARKIYVGANRDAKLAHIAPGSYRVQFAHGSTYLRTRGRFCHDEGSSEFVDPMAFQEIEDATGITFSADTITLHTVIGGNARTRRLSSLATAPDDTIPDL